VEKEKSNDHRKIGSKIWTNVEAAFVFMMR